MKLILLITLLFSLGISLTPQQEDYLANFGTAYIVTDTLVKVFKVDPLIAGGSYMLLRTIKEAGDTPPDLNDLYVSVGGIIFKYTIGF